MEAKKLFDTLKRKLEIKTDGQLSDKIGITHATLIKWKNNKTKLSVIQIAAIIKKAIERSAKHARQYSINPIVEYYPIDTCESKQGAKWEILDTSTSRGKKIRDSLSKVHGIYIFYNSQCNAIYIGKAKRLTLWNEMNGAFNRERDAQIVWKVQHPTTGKAFSPAFEMPRQIVKKKVFLHDISQYFSAYSIARDLIDNSEALLIRSFANDLTNLQMETISTK